MQNNQAYDAAQIEAVESNADKTLVLSGAGSGKTRVLVGRIRHLLESGLSPSKIIAITFTNSAAKVMTERCGVKLGYCGTLHSFLLRLLNNHAHLVNFQPGISIIDEDRQEEILLQIRASQRYRGSEEELKRALRKYVSTMADPSDANKVAAAYRIKLRQSNAVDFNGLLHYGKMLLDKLVQTKLWQYECLLVDEMQDTSDEFMAIYNAMPCKKFFVGDKNQSIFSYLGGNVSNIVEAMKGGAHIVKLETNYRCAESICAAASSLIYNEGGLEKCIPRPDAPFGRCELVCCADVDAELRFIATKIRDLGCEKDCGVLLRTNALCDEYRKGLAGFSIPIAKRTSTLQPCDWRLAKALLAALAEPDNDLLAEGYLNASKGRSAALALIAEAAQKQMSLNEYYLHLPHALNAQQAIDYAIPSLSLDSSNKLQQALITLESGAEISELLIALAEPEKEQKVESGVTVTTYHSAKGLEWNTVFLPAFEEGIIPSNRSIQLGGAAVDEERRVAYVGITRAEQNLFVSYARTRQEKFGRFEHIDRQVSRFAAQAHID